MVDASDHTRERLLRKILDEPVAHRGEYLIAFEAAFNSTVLPEKVEQILADDGYKVGKRRGIRTANIINDFFEADHFSDKRILEIGPGQYAFALLARTLGASVEALEYNPRKSDAGRELGFKVYNHDMHKLSQLGLSNSFDGLWLKGTFNPILPPTPTSAMRDFVGQMDDVLRPGAWAWCCPNIYDRTPGDHTPTSTEQKASDEQAQVFVDAGWDLIPIQEDDRVRYALKSLPYRGAKYIFVRNLRAPAPPSGE